MADKIIVTQDTAMAVREKGISMNTAIEQENFDRIKELRETSKNLANLSPVKLALYDAGISSSQTMNAIFKTEQSEFLFPAYMADLIETSVGKSDIMQYLVNGDVGVDSNVVNAPTLDLHSDENKKAMERARVAEGAEFPMKIIKTGSGTAYLYKKGIGIQQTYESLRRTQIDVAGRMLRAVSSDVVQQNVADATKVLESGTLHSIGTTATANVVTREELYDAVLDYFLKYNYAPTTLLADATLWKSIVKLTYNDSEIFGGNKKLTLNVPQIGLTTLNVIYAPVSAKGGKARFLLYNKDFSLLRYVENGSVLTEYDTKVTNQTNTVIVSEVSGFAKMINSVSEVVSA